MPENPFIMSLGDDLVTLSNVYTAAFCPTHAFSLIILIHSTMSNSVQNPDARVKGNSAVFSLSPLSNTGTRCYDLVT